MIWSTTFARKVSFINIDSFQPPPTCLAIPTYCVHVSIWTIYYKSLTRFKAILGRISLLNYFLGDLGWGRYKLPRLILTDFCSTTFEKMNSPSLKNHPQQKHPTDSPTKKNTCSFSKDSRILSPKNCSSPGPPLYLKGTGRIGHSKLRKALVGDHNATILRDILKSIGCMGLALLNFLHLGSFNLLFN